MIIEHALLTVDPARHPAFEAAFQQATPIISAMPGFRSLSLSRVVERSAGYLLLVEWDRIEDHTEGFRRSAGYQRWRELLHDFYDPFPVVEHAAPVHVVTAGTQPGDTREDATTHR